MNEATRLELEQRLTSARPVDDWCEEQRQALVEVQEGVARSIELHKATHLVLFQNQQMDSSQHGRGTIMVVGPECTCKTVEEVEGKHLNDAPSRRQYPVAWAKV